MNGVLLSAEGYGFDTYLFWTSECQKYEGVSESSKENSPICNFHLNALNQFHQPPGVLVYNSGITDSPENEFHTKFYFVYSEQIQFRIQQHKIGTETYQRLFSFAPGPI